MKKSILSIISIAILAFTSLGFDRANNQSIVRITLNQYSKQMKHILNLKLDVAGVDLGSRHVDLVVTDAEIKMLRSQGYNPVVVKKPSDLRRPDQQYFTSAKVEDTLKKFASAYPTISQLKLVGKSLEGRNILAMRITSAKNNGKKKPTILFNGMHHAREVMSVEVPMDIIETLLTQYGKNAAITHWVDANEIWVLPMFNVDGNNMIWNNNAMWRKNTHGGYGVDINRNYPYAWNTCNGSSGATTAQDYRGPNAGSEPETQVMMNLVKTIRPVFDISFHSYSELVIYPFGCPGVRAPNQAMIAAIGAEIAKSIPSDKGTGTYKPGVAPDLLYPVDGGDIDWMLHEYQVIPFVIELNSTAQGFQPSYATWRNKTVANLRAGWQVLLKKLDGPSIRGVTRAGAKVRIEGVNSKKPFVYETTARDDGFFNIIVTSGQYRVITENSVGTPAKLTETAKVVTVTNSPVEL